LILPFFAVFAIGLVIGTEWMMTRMTVDQAIVALRRTLDQTAPTVGDRIAPERQLVQLLGCSRETVRRALGVLEQEGLLWRHVGQGTFRGRRPDVAPLRDQVHIEVSSVHDVMRARLLIEPVIAAEAARRAVPSDIDHLRRCLVACRTGKDSFACEQADRQFHAAIAQVAGNTVLSAVLRYLSDIRRRAVWQREWDLSYRRVGVREFTGDHSDQHQTIVDAVAAAQDTAAAAAMHAHLETIAVVLNHGQGRSAR
jgi:DNA-binding FadR family transcriptional regulator